MIPKIIHYCWFGNNPIPKKEQKCIESWKKFFPDFEIKKWDESNFDYSSCKFSRQAYESRNFAFVSDYARAKILYEEGGLYFDTDVEIIKSFSEMIKGNGFMGFERRHFLGTAVIASEKKNPLIKKLLDYYQTNDFITKDGFVDNIANVSILTDIFREQGLTLGGKRQTVSGFEIFDREVFYPKKINEDEFRISEETLAVHKCSNSWMTDREKKRGSNSFWINVCRPVLRKARNTFQKTLGKEKTRKIEIKTRNRLR